MNQIANARLAEAPEAAALMQVVMLGIGDEVFALDSELVREIIDPVPATRVAGATSFRSPICGCGSACRRPKLPPTPASWCSRS
jgi:chemotaxis signal transduction protein